MLVSFWGWMGDVLMCWCVSPFLLCVFGGGLKDEG